MYLRSIGPVLLKLLYKSPSCPSWSVPSHGVRSSSKYTELAARMDDFRPPPKLSFEGDVAEQWREWRQLFELYLEAKEATGKEDKTKVAMLLSAMGPAGVSRYNQFEWATGEDKNKFDIVVNKFETELIGERRVVFNRHQFWEYQPSAGLPSSKELPYSVRNFGSE